MKILSKSFYISTGLILTVVGGLSIWQTMNVINTPVKKVNLDSLRDNAFNNCLNKARQDSKYGFETETSKKGDKIIIKTDDLTEWQTKIYASSEILSQCQGLKMVTFCFGEECDMDGNAESKEPGMIMTLEYDKESEVIVAK